jgi:outer membrane protein OmpA-like peptidoglycan-associated protein
MQNRFNINQALSIDLTVNYTLARATLFPQPTIKSPRFNALNFYVGVTYRFNKRNFNRVGATDEEVAAMLAIIAEKEGEINQITAENTKLLRINAEQLKQINNATVKISEYSKEVVDENKQIESLENPIQAANAQEAIATDNYNEILFYLYGYGTLSADNKTRLDLLAEHIKQSSSDRVFRIEGFADPQTGTEKCNIRLAEKRARLAYDYLISKGVDESKLEWKSGGTTHLPFKHKEQNRVVVIF